MVFNITVLQKLREAKVDLFEIIKNNHQYILNCFTRVIEECDRATATVEPKYVDYIHIKDAVYSNRENVLCGTGDGQILPILKDAFEKEAYEGFLTLEPHLVIFSSLSGLEKGNPHDVILKNKFSSGEEGYQAQYQALLSILDQISTPEV